MPLTPASMLARRWVLSITAGKSAIDATFLVPLLIAALGFSFLLGGVILARMRTLLAEIQTEARLRRKALG